MAYAKRLIVHADNWDDASLSRFVEDCLADRVVLICVVGDDCERVGDAIDALIVGDGSRPDRFITTTSHPDETLDKVRTFAAAWPLDGLDDDPVEVVRAP